MLGATATTLVAAHGSNSSTLSMLVMSFARAGQPLPHELCEAVLVTLRRTGTGTLDTQTLALTLWALTRLRACPRELLATAAADAAWRLRDFSTHSLSLLLWSIATAGYHDDALFSAAAALLVQRLRSEQFNGQTLSNIAYAYGVTRHYHPALMDCMAEVGRESAAQVLASDVTASHLLLSLSQLHYRDEQLVGAWAEHMAGAASSEGAAVDEKQGAGAAAHRRTSRRASSSNGSDAGAQALPGADAAAQCEEEELLQQAQRYLPFVSQWSLRALSSCARSLAALNHWRQRPLVAALLLQFTRTMGAAPPSPTGRRRAPAAAAAAATAAIGSDGDDDALPRGDVLGLEGFTDDDGTSGR